MNFLLKIVEGPNRGAEIALVEGVSVTLGKTDSCDIVLADATLPDAPLAIEASATGVTVDGIPLEPFHVRTAGATALAVGPADAPWGPLVWPKAEEEAESPAPEAEKPSGTAVSHDAEEPAKAGADETNGSTEQRLNGQTGGRRRRGCFGCLLAVLVILLILLALGWIFREALRPRALALRERAAKWRVRGGGSTAVIEADVPVSASFAIEKLASRYGLELEEGDGRARLSGNFATRAERLRATAEAYASRPGIELDLSDDESFLTSAEDALFNLTEGALKVTVATNRYLHLAGTSESPLTLQKTLEQLNSDLPKLRGVDVSDVKLVSPMSPADALAATVQPSNGQTVKRPARPAAPVLPVCGILTTPYPCLVMRDGRRILEGGAIGDATILSIAADEVTVTNSAGRFTWKP